MTDRHTHKHTDIATYRKHRPKGRCFENDMFQVCCTAVLYFYLSVLMQCCSAVGGSHDGRARLRAEARSGDNTS